MEQKFIEKLSPVERDFVARVRNCPPECRGAALARVVDVAWGAIRPYVRSRVLVCLADIVAGLVKLDLLHRGKSSAQEVIPKSFLQPPVDSQN